MRKMTFGEKFLIWTQIKLRWIWVLIGFPYILCSSIRECSSINKWRKKANKEDFQDKKLPFASFKKLFQTNWKLYLDLIEKDD